MRKLTLYAVSASAALVCAAIPVSWSPANVTLLSLDTADARVGRPLTATSVAGVNRRVTRRAYRRAAVGTAAVGAAAVGGYAVGGYGGGGYAAGAYPGGSAGPGPGVVVPPGASATVISASGRRCTIEPSGYRWCWTP
jgi:uncharacterized membrane protein